MQFLTSQVREEGCHGEAIDDRFRRLCRRPGTPTRGGGKPGKTRMEKMLDVVERVGNKVPHPVVIFVLLIGLVILLSHVFYMMGASVTYQSINPETHEVEEVTTQRRAC